MSPRGIIVAQGRRPRATMIPRGDIPLCCTHHLFYYTSYLAGMGEFTDTNLLITFIMHLIWHGWANSRGQNSWFQQLTCWWCRLRHMVTEHVRNIVALLWRPSGPQSLVMLPAKMLWWPSGPQSLVMLPAKMADRIMGGGGGDTHLGYGILGGKKSGIWDMRAKKSGIWDMGKSSGIWDIGVEIINF